MAESKRRSSGATVLLLRERSKWSLEDCVSRLTSGRDVVAAGERERSAGRVLRELERDRERAAGRVLRVEWERDMVTR